MPGELGDLHGVVRIGDVPDANVRHVTALAGRQESAIAGKGQGRDRFAASVQHVSLGVLAWVEQHHGAAATREKQFQLYFPSLFTKENTISLVSQAISLQRPARTCAASRGYEVAKRLDTGEAEEIRRYVPVRFFQTFSQKHSRYDLARQLAPRQRINCKVERKIIGRPAPISMQNGATNLIRFCSVVRR